MLTDIYARSMMTATRQSCLQLRDLPAPSAPCAPPAPSMGLIRRQIQRITGLIKAPLLSWRRLNQPVRCIDLQNL